MFFNYQVFQTKAFGTIGDRSVSGLVARDQLIGSNQVPVSNFSITKTDINSSSGQALTMGEKPNIK